MFFHFKRNRAQKAERKPPRFLILKRKWLTLAAAGLAAAAIFASHSAGMGDGQTSSAAPGWYLLA